MKVELADKAKQQLKKLPKNEQKKVVRKLKLLESIPFSGKKLGGELTELYALRAWPYRIIYTIDQKRQEITVNSILHRQGAYR